MIYVTYISQLFILRLLYSVPILLTFLRYAAFKNVILGEANFKNAQVELRLLRLLKMIYLQWLHKRFSVEYIEYTDSWFNKKRRVFDNAFNLKNSIVMKQPKQATNDFDFDPFFHSQRIFEHTKL